MATESDSVVSMPCRGEGEVGVPVGGRNASIARASRGQMITGPSQRAQTALGAFIQRGLVTPVLLPVHVEAVQHRAAEHARGFRRQ